MISKLIAWGADRPQAIARMRRALREYDVLGIRTTVPFFTWMLDQPDFLAGRFDTSYLDDVLGARQGQPFAVASDELIDIAAIAAAVYHAGRLEPAPTKTPATTTARVAGQAASDPQTGWKTRGRLEGLRE